MSSHVNNPNPSSSDNVPYVHAPRIRKDEKTIIEKTSSCVTAISTLLQLPNSASHLKKSCSPNKSFTSVGPVCRICHEDDSSEKLISPCECIGSMGVVHTSCLEKWLSTSNSDNCEICKYNFRTKRRARPIFQWFCNGQSIHGPHGFYGDILCLLLLTPLCFISVYLCGVGSIVYMKHGVWEGIGLAVLSAFLLITFILWCFVTLRFHWRTLLTWRNTNQVVELMEYQCQSRQRTDNNANRVAEVRAAPNEPCINV
ncbi:unnamed protein product [Bemisia tabaci]|uniref:Uncharacterized protein n=1 Tax=Bemisia tabaci TaxID=7038 RepID=A0A9P0AJC5_BEMTA|nr:PREDICTED: E3 ubiquitin-protein ligase MARCH3-like [Bemisia tabaci]CAH0393063.1 unnamed protein product [Bemisia tabaci]